MGYLITHLVVEGSAMDESRYAANSSSGLHGCSSSLVSRGQGCSSSGMLPPQIPNTQPKPLHQSLHVKISQSANVKIIQAKLFYDNNKPEFEGNNQTFVEVSEKTANINYIMAAVQRKYCLRGFYASIESQGNYIVTECEARGYYAFPRDSIDAYKPK